MATEIGGIQLGKGTFLNDPSKPGTAEKAIQDFFKGFGSNPSFQNLGADHHGKQTHWQDSAGHSVTVYNEGRVHVKAGDTTVVDGGHKIVGSQGDDHVLVVDGNNHMIHLGQGNDSLTLAGSGSTHVFGGQGDDTFTVAGSGNNVLKGGAGNDTFVFTAGATGNNVIKDFHAGDILQIQDRDGSGVVDTKDAQISSDGHGNTVISLDGGGSVTLKNVDAATLTESDSTNGIFHI